MNLLRRMSCRWLIREPRIVGAHLAVLSTLVASTALVAASPARAQPTASVVAPSASAINGSLADLAKLFAGAVTDKEFRQTIHDSVAQRFDGDTDVLWKVLAQKPGARSALAKVEARKSGTSTLRAENTVTTLANRIPRLQIAVPANFAKWNPAVYTPLVAYMPAGVDDTKLKTVTAFDAAGRAFQLDARVVPRQPVIVLGVNERTDDSAALLPGYRPTERPALSDSATSDTRLAAAAVTSYQVRVILVALVHDNEPWAAGSAEISMKAKSRGCSGVDYKDVDWDGLNNDDDMWFGDSGGTVPRYIGNTTCDVVFYWWEDDAANTDYQLAVGKFELGVGMSNADDIIGHSQLTYASFKGATDQQTTFSDLYFFTD